MTIILATTWLELEITGRANPIIFISLIFDKVSDTKISEMLGEVILEVKLTE
jgi:hypothetical protein